MKAVLPLLVATSVAADPLELRPAPPAGAYPELVATERACEADGDHAHLLRAKRARIAGHDVHILHECGSTDAMSRLAIRTPDGWALIDGPTIAYRAGNMTDAPAHVSLIDESLSTGTFEDAPAIVYQSTTLHRAASRSVRCDTREARNNISITGRALARRALLCIRARARRAALGIPRARSAQAPLEKRPQLACRTARRR